MEFDLAPGAFCSPCDGLLSCFEIAPDSVFRVKHTEYSLPRLLESDETAEAFSGGTALVFRLTPSHYHRYCFNDGGRVTVEKDIPGILHCVRPIATEAFPVYIRNSRSYCVIESENFGTMVQMEVGALFVGRIKNHPVSGPVRRGDEKGCFEFGGSTVIMLVQKGALVLPEALFSGEEFPVVLGERLN